MRGAGIRDIAWPCGKVSDERAAGPRISIGERSTAGRRHEPRRATALADPGRLHRMPAAHECFGDWHYPCGSRFASEDRRRRQNAGSGLLRGGDCRQASPIGAIGNCKWLQGTPFPPDSAAHPLSDAPLSRRGEPGDEAPKRTISGISGGGTDPRGPDGVSPRRGPGDWCSGSTSRGRGTSAARPARSPTTGSASASDGGSKEPESSRPAPAGRRNTAPGSGSPSGGDRKARPRIGAPAPDPILDRLWGAQQPVARSARRQHRSMTVRCGWRRIGDTGARGALHGHAGVRCRCVGRRSELAAWVAPRIRRERPGRLRPRCGGDATRAVRRGRVGEPHRTRGEDALVAQGRIERRTSRPNLADSPARGFRMKDKRSTRR